MDIDQSIDLKRENAFDDLVLYTSVALFTLLLAITVFQVIVREIPVDIPFSMSWTTNVARISLVLVTYVGAAVATRNNEQISISIVLDKLEEYSPGLRRSIDVINHVLVLAFLGAALYGLVSSAAVNWETTAAGLSAIKVGHVYLGIAVGFLFMTVYTLQALVDSLRALRSPPRADRTQPSEATD